MMRTSRVHSTPTVHGNRAHPTAGSGPGSKAIAKARRLLDWQRGSPSKFDTLEDAVMNCKTLDDLAARIGKAIENSPAKDIERNVKAMLQSSLARLDVVPRAEFD